MTIDRESLYSMASVALQNILWAIEGWRIQRDDRYPPAFSGLVLDVERRAQSDEERSEGFGTRELLDRCSNALCTCRTIKGVAGLRVIGTSLSNDATGF